MSRQAFLDQTMPHQKIIYKVVNAYTDNKEDKEDLLQEIWLQLWLSFPLFRSQSKVSTWMYQVALNTTLTYTKKASIRNKHLSDAPIWDDDKQVQHEQERLLWELIRSLPKADKALILLYIDGISYKEISEITGESESNVGVKLNRIRQKMKNDLKNSSNGNA